MIRSRSNSVLTVYFLATSAGCFEGRSVGTGAVEPVEPVDAGVDVGIDTGLPDVGPFDGAASETGPDPVVDLRERCFPGMGDPARGVPNYDQFRPIVGSHCRGTNHQDITGVEKLVFLGDSVTEGTPPNLPNQYYRSIVEQAMRERFGDLEVSECAEWGARTDDLMKPPHEQVLTCFPAVENKRTLVLMTLGGNDMANCAKNNKTAEECSAQVDEAVTLFEEGIKYLKDPINFPNGSFVVYANVYEYTDGTGNLMSCPQSILAGYPADWSQGRPAYIHANEEFMRIATETRSDIAFMLEHFCGHGFKASDPSNECYRGEGAETWFDFTCIHPNPTGHAALADLFISTINE